MCKREMLGHDFANELPAKWNDAHRAHPVIGFQCTSSDRRQDRTPDFITVCKTMSKMARMVINSDCRI